MVGCVDGTNYYIFDLIIFPTCFVHTLFMIYLFMFETNVMISPNSLRYYKRTYMLVLRI